MKDTFLKFSLNSTTHCLALTLLLNPATLHALPTYDPQDPNGQDQTCLPDVVVSGEPLMIGSPLVGQTVKVVGDQVKLFDTGELCSGSRVALRPGEFEWEFLLPAGSAGIVQDADTLNPRIVLDVPGAYQARLTACPDGCTFESVGSSGIPTTVEVEPQLAKVVFFETVPVLPPETQPALPASALVPADRTRSTKEERINKCSFGGGVIDPQWVTVDEFSGPMDYSGGNAATGKVHMIEGVVYKSKVSRKDSPRNHKPQDHNFALKPDPAHRYVIPLFDDGEGAQKFVELEWETNVFGANFRPGNGDRVSAFGYLIYDCGHPPFRVEIHPPVGLAVHRNRAIRIPDNPAPENIVNWPGGPVGQNIYVPGVMTEVVINPYGGKMMEGSNGTQLHQPARLRTDLDPPRPERGDAITDPSPVGGAVYTFNIYLPRSPKAALEAAGVTGLPDIPLYYRVTNLGAGSMPLEVEPVTEGDVTYLKATIDFRHEDPDPGLTLEAQVVAAWVYPSPEPDNWGLQRWRLHVDSLLVHDDSDGTLRGAGEWTLWFHANNAEPGSDRHEWTNIINSGISDHSIITSPSGQKTIVTPRLHDFGGRRWSTGDDVGPDRYLGPDLLLFPGQTIQVHASGFEDDSFSSDSLALIDEGRAQLENSYASRNRCKNSDDLDSLVYSGCADYELNYQAEYRGAPPGSALSSTAQDLMDAYNFGESTPCPGNDDVCGPVIVGGSLPDPIQEEPWHPDSLVLIPGQAAIPAFETTLFKPQGIEEYALTEISFADFDDLISRFLESDPEEVDHLLSDMRAIIDEKLDSVGPEVLLDVQVLCASLPNRLCKIYFGDLPVPQGPENPGYGRFTGSGKLKSQDSTSLSFSIHCDFLRYPNQFGLRWGNRPKHHFKMDLMTTSSCDQEPGSSESHQGWALGRLDGVPGAMAWWTLTDGGEPSGADTVHIKVFDAGNAVIHEAFGNISGGNIQSHEY